MSRRGLLWSAGGATTLVALVALVALVRTTGAATAPWGGLGFGSDAESIPTVEVERGAFVREIHADGDLQAVRATPLTVPREGRRSFQIAWMAPDGRRVAAGDVVVRFDPTEMALELAEARDDLAANRLRVHKGRAEARATRDNLARDATAAELELEGAREFRKKNPELFSRHEILESEMDEGLAERQRDHAVSSEVSQDRLSRTRLDILAIESRQAQQKIDDASDGLASLEIRAPHDGLLVFRRDWKGNRPRVGEALFAGNPVAEIPDLSEMQAELYVLEADAAGLRVGQPAKVTVEAYPGESFVGEVTRLDNLAQPRRRGSPVQYLALTVALDSTDPQRMKPGQRVRAVLEVERLDDVLVVPRQAVFEEDGRSVVFRAAGDGVGDGFEETPVEVAATGTGRVAIRSGLDAGDRVALTDPRRPATPEASSEEGPPAPPGEGAG